MPLIATGSASVNNALLLLAVLVIFGVLGHVPGSALIWLPVVMIINVALALEFGAFWAYYSMWYFQSIPFSGAYCLEPDAKHIAVGQENMRLNGLDASLVHASAGDQCIAAKLFSTESGESVLIPQHTVPSVMAHFRLENIELVQGVEFGLLSNCAPLLAAGKIRFLVVSTHHVSISGSPTTHADFVARLKANGASILCEHDVDESFSGDGLIVADMRSEDSLISPIVIS